MSLSTALLISQLAITQQFTFGAPTGTVTEGFSRVVAAAELSDGRLLVADGQDNSLVILDFRGRSAVQLGRNGQGPNEYLRPFGIVRGPGDTLFVYDPFASQFLRVDPAGRIAGSIPWQLAMFAGGISPPRGIDAAGRFYLEGGWVGTENGQPKRNLSATVRRWRIGGDSTETVATIADHAVEMHPNRFFPFPQRDTWVLTPDGKVGVLVAADYHLRWIENGRVVSEGPRIPFTRVSVDAGERDAFRRERAAQPAAGVRIGGGATAPVPSGAPQGMQRMLEAYPDNMFPQYKPPFVEGGARRAPNGDIWVTRSVPHTETRALIDVLDSRGRLRGSLRLPPNSRLLALEKSAVYLVRTDSDGLQWVERFAWPY